MTTAPRAATTRRRRRSTGMQSRYVAGLGDIVREVATGDVFKVTHISRWGDASVGTDTASGRRVVLWPHEYELVTA